MSLALRLMALEDIEQISAIEKEAFASPWSPRTYAYEIMDSQSSHMVVLADGDTPQSGMPFLRALMPFRQGRGAAHVLAYGGLWNLTDEAHISTIASHPDHRRSGYGEAVFAAMVMRSIVLDVAFVALEVRISNVGAQALYHKYGFEIHGIKPRYYLDNFEDAYDMRLVLGAETRRAVTERFESLRARLGFTDTYTHSRHNRD